MAKPFGGSDPPAALFHYSRDRGGKHPRGHLAEWSGILQADAYAGFNALYVKGRVPAPLTEASCWAHGGAKFFELADLAKAMRAPMAIEMAIEAVRRIDEIFAIERELGGEPAERRRIVRQAALAEASGAPLVACNDVHYHVPARRRLGDVLTAIRHRTTVAEAGWRLAANAERHLKPPAEMARLFAAWPDAIRRTVEIAERCRFRLDELKYEYPSEPVPAGETAQSALERLTWAGARNRYGAEVPARVRAQLAHELNLIGELGYAPYFLTVQDLVRFAKGRGILCQGRGSAANSAVCYCLEITVRPEGAYH